ncbi:hypothetical protein ES705_34222 [subsurface metagenome]
MNWFLLIGVLVVVAGIIYFLMKKKKGISELLRQSGLLFLVFFGLPIPCSPDCPISRGQGYLKIVENSIAGKIDKSWNLKNRTAF